MKLVTWNVNSLKARLPRVLEFLELHAPDVAALQETKVEGDAFPEAELREAGYASVHHSAGRWAGVALLTRSEPAAEPVYGLPGEAAADEARWVEGTVGGLRIASVYVPNGRAVGSDSFAQKLQFLEAMARRAAAGIDVVVGDMNVCPADLDVYNPEAFIGSTHVTEDERARLRAVLDAGGLRDAFRGLHADEPGFTWWDYRQGHFHRKMGLRIDLALVREGIAVRACGIDRNFRKGPKPSDHAPLLVELGS